MSQGLLHDGAPQCSLPSAYKGNFDKHPGQHPHMVGAVFGNEGDESPFVTTYPSSQPGGHHLSQDIVSGILSRGCFSEGREKNEQSPSIRHELNHAGCFTHLLSLKAHGCRGYSPQFADKETEALQGYMLWSYS